MQKYSYTLANIFSITPVIQLYHSYPSLAIRKKVGISKIGKNEKMPQYLINQISIITKIKGARTLCSELRIMEISTRTI